MITREQLFVGGRWVQPAGDEWLTVVSPSTEEPVGRVPVAVEADIDRAVDAAQRAFHDGPWPRMSLDERAVYLRRMMQAYSRRSPAAIDLQIDEMGGTRKFFQQYEPGQVPFMESLVAAAGEVLEPELRPGFAGQVLVLREPIGVVAAITPWNSPIMTMWTKLWPALLAGCPIILKPPPESPLSPYLVAEAIEEAEIPHGVVSVIPAGREVGAYLVSHPGVDKVSFTGSAIGGSHVASACGSQIKSATLELGGKSAGIIIDGDLQRHVRSVAELGLRNAGQLCIAPTRILVNEVHYDDVVALLVEYVRQLVVGDPHRPETDMGPLVGERQRTLVEGYIASGLQEGAKLAIGGGRPVGLDRGFYVEPTVFVNVDNSMRIAQQEIFGPVLSVIPFRSDAEAVSLANDSMYGLAGAVYTADLDRGLAIAKQMRTGTVSINDAPPAGGGGPFGGYKRSGLGRERSREGIESYLEIKSVTLPSNAGSPAA